jgi:hypothetical protein
MLDWKHEWNSLGVLFSSLEIRFAGENSAQLSILSFWEQRTHDSDLGKACSRSDRRITPHNIGMGYYPSQPLLV